MIYISLMNSYLLMQFLTNTTKLKVYKKYTILNKIK